jgi:membrane-associated phospholipid phosphatase
MSDAIEPTPDDGTKVSEALLNGAGETELMVSPRRAAARARWAEIVFVIALGLYGLLAGLAHTYAYFDWDVRINHAIRSVALPGFGQLMVALSWLGSGVVPTILVVGAGMALYAARFRLEGILCMIGTSLGAVMNSLMKLAIGRPRPDPELIDVMRHYEHNSFPSGHVEFFVIFFGFLLFLSYVLLKPGWLRRLSFVLFGLLIALIGVSRVYMGAHWPSDTVGAYLAGGVWLMLMIEIYRRMKAHQRPTAETRRGRGEGESRE